MIQTQVSTTRQERDPIERVKRLCLEQGLADAAEFKSIEKKIKQEVDAVIEECKKANAPGMDYMAKYVYVDPSPFAEPARGVALGTQHKYQASKPHPSAC
jgi:TPP-dependent pyruvate/acetoin dehydrogenase alpha subunit